MKRIDFSKEKNQKLVDERGISFETLAEAIRTGGLITIEDHPHKEKYKHQKMFIVLYRNYVYCVPYVEDDEKIFLKTVFPSRKQTKKYLKEKTYEKTT